MKNVFIMAMIGFILIAGCTSGSQDVTSFVQTLPQVKAFLQENPNANIRVVLMDSATVETNMDSIEETCGIRLPVQQYYFVTVEENNDKVFIWLNQNQEVQCLARQGPGGTEPEQTPIQEDDSIQETDEEIETGDQEDTEVSEEEPSEEIENDVPGPEIETGTESEQSVTETEEGTTEENEEAEETETVEESLAETTALVGEIEYQFADVQLNNTKNNVSKINIRYANHGETKLDVDQDLGFKIINENGETVGEKTGARILTYDFIGGGYENESVNFTNAIVPGTHTLKVEFYAKGTNTVLASMEKEIQMGPTAESIQSGNVQAQRDLDELSELSEQITLGGIQYGFSDVQLSDQKNNLKAVNLRYVNVSENKQDVDIDLKISLVDEDGIIVNGRTGSGRILTYDFIGIGFENESAGQFYDLKTGTYALIVDFYNRGFNEIVGSIVKPVEIGPRAEEIQASELLERTVEPQDTVSLGDVTYVLKKIKLSDRKNNVSTAGIDFTRNGTKIDVDVDLKVSVINADGKIASTRTSKERILEYDHTGTETKNVSAGQFYDLKSGSYTLVVDFYTPGFNEPVGYLAKTFQIGASAAQEQ